MSAVTAVPSSSTPTVVDTGAPQTTDRAQLQKLAEEFESMLLLQVMRQVRQTVTSFGDDQSEGAVGGDMSAMTDTIDGELARYLSRSGGFGLARALSRSLASSPAPASPSNAGNPSASEAAGTSPLPDAAAAPVGAPLDEAQGAPRPDAAGVRTQVDSMLSAHVNSSFGWRNDPIQHVRRFHGGVDLRAAYGQAVPAAAQGRVVSAGVQGDYGLSVLVDHGNGFQTRYAHLSSIDVAPGDLVPDGAPVGRAGQSGRATGPHLHLEVLRDGERVDPRQWLTSDEFKKVVAHAD